jgi:hypothetical protein
MDGDGLLATRPWRDADAPQEVRSLPTMLSRQELALLYWLARDYATGRGAIVDAGCFLGGSSAALLAGVRDRPEPWTGPPVYSYDRFIVEAYTLETYFSGHDDVREGGSFRRFYDENVAGYGVPHEVRDGDITAIGWHGDPIEVLFLDVLKAWEINDSVARDFFPSLIPGRSVIVHQDYAYGFVPWLHITVELMRDSLRLLDDVPYATQMFIVDRPIDPDVFAGVARLDDREKLRLMDQAVEANEGDTRDMVRLSQAWLLHTVGDTGRARALADRIRRRTSSSGVRECAVRTLERLGGRPSRLRSLLGR